MSSSSPFSESYDRFVRSMSMSLDKWRDGEGYDLDALAGLDGDERIRIETMLRARSDWRDVRALARLKPPAVEALREAFASNRLPLISRLTAAEELKELGERVDVVCLQLDMLNRGRSDLSILTRVSDHICWNLPADTRVKFRILQVLDRTTEPVATSFAALAFVVWGLCESTWDWSHRPFWLRFQDAADHDRAFDELLERIGLSRSDVRAAEI